MALVIPGIDAIITMIVKPLIMNRAKAFAKMIYAKLKGRADENALADELINAIEMGQVDSFIMKYEKSIPKEVIEKIRALANMRELFNKASRIISAQKYSQDAAKVFIDLARILDDVMVGMSFEEAGIEDVTVQDAETNDQIHVTSEDYMVALLFRYAAAVWTQIAAMATPMARGWTLTYDAKMEVTLGKPQVNMKRAAAPPMASIAKDESAAGREMGGPRPGFLEFRAAYENLMPLYRNGLAIRDQYLDSVSCLKTALIKVKSIKRGRQDKMHKHMDPRHLEGLILAFRGEAQYWQYRVSDELAQSAAAVKNFFEEDSKQVKEWMNFMDVPKEGFKEFLDALTLYRNFPEGLAGALRLYKEGAEKCVDGKDRDMIFSRIGDLQAVSSYKPAVFVPDPRPIL
ncbi:MAG: hypothetical protein WED04_10135 [Promethearchaeati archaeon SRVP18_Atabeyarchaeia-1]